MHKLTDLTVSQPFVFGVATHPKVLDFHQCLTPRWLPVEKRVYGDLYNASLLIPLYFVPLAVIVFCYSQIYFIVLRRAYDPHIGELGRTRNTNREFCFFQWIGTGRSEKERWASLIQKFWKGREVKWIKVLENRAEKSSRSCGTFFLERCGTSHWLRARPIEPSHLASGSSEVEGRNFLQEWDDRERGRESSGEDSTRKRNL